MTLEQIAALIRGQHEHPVYPVVPADVLRQCRSAEELQAVVDIVNNRRVQIEAMKDDPFNYGYEPPMWRKIYTYMAKQRLNMPSQVLIFYVFGGKRSGKTDLGGKLIAAHLAAFEPPNDIGQYKAWAWCVHQTEPRSKDIGQKRVHHYLPRDWKKKIGGKDGKLNYQEGNGFTNNAFIVDSRNCGFLFFGMDPNNMQGSELTAAWPDELVPPVVVNILNERLSTRAATAACDAHQRKIRGILLKLERTQDRLTPEEVGALMLGVNLITFTPVEGFTQVAAHALNGATTIESESAEALPIFGPDNADGSKNVTGYEMAPRVQQCVRKNEMIFYLWTKDNKWGGYDALLELSKGQGGDALKINLYGWVTKSWRGSFPGFATERHVIDWNQVPKEGTCYLRVDLGKSKPWVMIWVWHARDGRRYVLNEWPREGDYIPGIGDPGAWAVPSAGTRQDGDEGPAQRPIGFGYEQYLMEMERIERQIAAWKDGSNDPLAVPPLELDRIAPINVEACSMDSRLGHDPTPKEGGTSTIIDDMNELCERLKKNRLFEPASGDQLKQGDSMINNALADLPDSLPRAPGLFVLRHCLGMRFMLENYTGQDGTTGKCKDWRDALVFDLSDSDACYVNPKKQGWH